MAIASDDLGVRLRAEARHQTALLVRDPGPMIGYVVMAALLITVNRPLYDMVDELVPGLPAPGIDQAAAGMAVMFSLFALKVVGGHLLNERTWGTWDRLRATPARFGEILFAKALPLLGVVVVQQAVLFAFSAAMFGLHPRSGWWALVVCGVAWSACVLLLGTAASTLARSPAQLSAGGDVFAIVTSVLAGALVPVVLLPGWLQRLAPASPGYWAMAAYRAALAGPPGALLRPLAMLAVFGAAGIAVGAVIGRTRT